jgi:predicted transposase/invertase (TIGR01784 family)
MDYDILPPTNDFVFKLLFGDDRNKSMLIDMLKSFVDLPDEEFELVFLDTCLKPEHEEDKMGILDVKVSTKTGKIIDIEIQVNPLLYIGERISFYKSRLIVDQIGKGEHYDKIQRVICVCITDHVIHKEDKRYLNYFCFCNPETGLCFKGIPEEIFTLELPKVPVDEDGNKVWAWLQFLRAKRKGEFDMIAAANPEIRKAVDILYEISADDKVRAEYNMRQKAWMDRQSQFDGYYKKGRVEGKAEGRGEGKPEGKAEGKVEAARNLKSLGVSTDIIIKSTGLSPEEIAQLPSR